MSDTVTDFITECSSCTQCGTVCPFLEKHGSPKDIIANRPQLAFLCTNCTGCDKRCPLELSPSEALFATKQKLIAEQRVPEKAAKAIRGAASFAERSHKAPFVRYDSKKVGFWPGCSLAGTSPEATEATRQLLESLLGEEVGLILDCCYDPLYQMGDTGPVTEACGRIVERLAKSGIERVIVGCVNCRKVFARYMDQVDVSHVIEVLPPDILKELPEDEDLYLHHPCPVYHVEGIREKITAVLGHSMMMVDSQGVHHPGSSQGEDPGVGVEPDGFTPSGGGSRRWRDRSTQNSSKSQFERLSISQAVDEQKIPACCGYGGSLNTQDEELSMKFTKRVTMAAYGATIVTSCMGCNNMFNRKGTPTYHILELITGVKPKKKAVGSARKWANRLLLAKGK
ncbi:MAG: (Fe-S)-binding protein [bacterium]|nr:(Fe-S)-binding protein [bacterium]